MGTNKRYAHYFNAKMGERAAESVMRDAEPDTLTAKQLDLKKEPVTRTPKPYPARAWVKYGDHSIEVDLEVVAWTERAIAIRWRGPDDAEQKAWVWRGACPGSGKARPSGLRRAVGPPQGCQPPTGAEIR